MNAESNETLPVSEKYMLTIKEAAAYFNIGIKKLRRIAEGQSWNSSDVLWKQIPHYPPEVRRVHP